MNFLIKLAAISSVIISLQTLALNAVGIKRYAVDMEENDICGLNPTIYNGKCKKIDKCVNLLVQKKDIEVCSFGSSNYGDDTLVCCSREDFYRSRKHNKEGVLNYDTCVNKYRHLRVAEKSKTQAFVVNGVDVESHEFSHIAAIGWIQWIDLSVRWHCAGNLITESFVMSAAHCMLFDNKEPNIARLGDVDLNSRFDDRHVQQFLISSIMQHPDYNYDTNEHDIALIKLRGSVVPSMNVVPACLNDELLTVEYFEGAGYGQDETFQTTNKLSKVYLKLVQMDDCKKSYDIQLSSDAQICAQGYRDDMPIQDLCYGDSGSAIQFMKSHATENDETFETPTLAGITSFGIGCAFEIPSVYVNISYYIDWMESIISP